MGKSRLTISSEKVHFPIVSGFNLQRQELEFPRDFGGELNILFIPFLQKQQAVVDTWVPFVQEIEAGYPGVVYYELPTIDERSRLSRTFINEGMRAGIPNQTARERTVTLYLDTDAFRQALAIPGRDEVHILLVDREGTIHWRTTGQFDQTKGDGLIQALSKKED